MEALVVFTTIAGTALAASSASEQRKNAKKQAELNKLSLDMSTEKKLNESADEFRRSVAAASVSAAGRGVSVTLGSGGDIVQGLFQQASEATNTLHLNNLFGEAQIAQQQAANSPDVFLSSVQGGLSGLQTGLALASAAQGLNQGTSSTNSTAVDNVSYQRENVAGLRSNT